MSEPKWTKAPWIVTTCMDYWVEPAIHPDDDEFYGIAHCGDIHWPGYEEKQKEWEANARLIAAAPDLYEALAACVEQMGGEDEIDADESAFPHWRAAVRALKAARGEPQ